MIVGALLAKNEADPSRYLRRVLRNAASFCDQLVVVDDGSTDDTAAICEEAGATVLRRDPAEGWFAAGERSARAQLWDAAVDAAGPAGWVYVFDADHELIGIEPDDFRLLTRASHVTCWAFPLADCWDSDATMRVDGYWQAHLRPRPWLFRAVPVPGFVPAWPERDIHVGHAPANYPLAAGIAPPPALIRHLGYVRPAHRAAKHARYLALA